MTTAQRDADDEDPQILRRLAQIQAGETVVYFTTSPAFPTLAAACYTNGGTSDQQREYAAMMAGRARKAMELHDAGRAILVQRRLSPPDPVHWGAVEYLAVGR